MLHDFGIAGAFYSGEPQKKEDKESDKKKEGGKQPHLVLLKEIPETAARAKVAVVDDDEAVILYLDNYLSRRGFSVKSFQTPDAALKLLEQESDRIGPDHPPFDLVLVDMRMPKLDGLAFAKRVSEWFPKLPIVFITAYGSIETAVAAIRQGATDYIEKPLSLHKLETILESVFAKKQD